MRAVIHSLALAGSLGLLAPLAASAQGPTPSQLLDFRPIQKDLPIDYDSPTEKAEIEACKVETTVDKKAGTFAYILRDAQGRLLRRCADTNGKKDPATGKTRLDQWSYFKDGFEVYREIDLNEDGLLDECRWLDAGGTRIAEVKNNRILAWKRISAEEASKVLVHALVSGNAGLIETVMAGGEELAELGLPRAQADAATKARDERAAAVEALRKQLKGWTPQTSWARFDGTLPHVIPADAGLKDDLVLYENAFVFVNPPEQGDPMELAYLQASEVVRIGETWKFVELPRVIDPQKPVATAVDGGIRAALYRVDSSGGSGASADPVLEQALKTLADHDQKAPGADSTKQELARFHVDRVNLLFQVIKSAPTPEEQLNFTRQAVDSLAAAYQTGMYQAAAERLTQYAGQTGPIAPYAAYRKVLAEYALDADQPGSDYIKVQKAFLEKLEAFLEKHPRSDETPDVLFQLASINEFNAEEEKARTFYARLVKDFSETPTGKKAAGAIRRLDLVGKELELAGAGLAGKSISADEFRGKVLLVTFWTTGADPVRRDLPELLKVYEKYQAKGFAVLGVNLDGERAALDEFLKGSPLPWPVIHEPGGMDSRLADEYGIISLPTMVLVDKDGKVLNRNIRTSGELDRFLEKLMTPAEAASIAPTETR